MPYKEIGTAVPFDSYETVEQSTIVVVGNIGIYGYQGVPGTTSVDVDAIDLNAAKSKLDASGKVEVLYMRLSWNETAPPTITDLVFGAVIKVIKPVAFAELWAYLPDYLLQILTDLQMIARNDFDYYSLGLKQSDYTYTWTWEGYSGEFPTIPNAPITSDADIRTHLMGTELDGIMNMFKAKLLQTDEHITATIKNYDFIISTVEHVRDILMVPIYRLHAKFQLDFDTDYPISASPVLPIFLTTIIDTAKSIITNLQTKIVTGIQTVFNFIKEPPADNFTTTSSEITTRMINHTVEIIEVTVPPKSTGEDGTPPGSTKTIPPGDTYSYTEMIPAELIDEPGIPWYVWLTIGISATALVALLIWAMKKH